MSKITRHEVGILNRDELLERIYKREAEWKQAYDDEVELLKGQYGELVEAVAQVERFLTQVDPVHWPSRSEARAIIKVVRDAQGPFLPPTSPADRLDALADKIHDTFNPTEDDVIELRALAAELREGES